MGIRFTAESIKHFFIVADNGGKNNEFVEKNHKKG